MAANSLRFTWSFLILALVLPGQAGSIEDRLDAAQAAGKPLVAHVIVCLCDNQHQGIVPVPASLGNGQDPASNLYWGARYGVDGWFRRIAAWKSRPDDRALAPGQLARACFERQLLRHGRPVTLRLQAEAWDGRNMSDALRRFHLLCAGYGDAHLVVFIGHNGFMEHPDLVVSPPRAGAPARAGLALACRSDVDFLPRIRRTGASPLLLTTGFMAPEAYTLDAVLEAWAGGGDRAAVHEAAAAAYHRYQKCGMNGARRLFEVYE